jgi:hypothetical protein
MYCHSELSEQKIARYDNSFLPLMSVCHVTWTSFEFPVHEMWICEGYKNPDAVMIKTKNIIFILNGLY